MKSTEKTCRDCNFCDKEKVYTPDSWDNTSKLTCKVSKKVISGYADWYDKIPVPKDCPLKGRKPDTRWIE